MLKVVPPVLFEYDPERQSMKSTTRCQYQPVLMEKNTRRFGAAAGYSATFAWFITMTSEVNAPAG